MFLIGYIVGVLICGLAMLAYIALTTERYCLASECRSDEAIERATENVVGVQRLRQEDLPVHTHEYQCSCGATVTFDTRTLKRIEHIMSRYNCPCLECTNKRMLDL